MRANHEPKDELDRRPAMRWASSEYRERYVDPILSCWGSGRRDQDGIVGEVE
jgi:hypothetical protein